MQKSSRFWFAHPSWRKVAPSWTRTWLSFAYLLLAIYTCMVREIHRRARFFYTRENRMPHKGSYTKMCISFSIHITKATSAGWNKKKVIMPLQTWWFDSFRLILLWSSDKSCGKILIAPNFCHGILFGVFDALSWARELFIGSKSFWAHWCKNTYFVLPSGKNFIPEAKKDSNLSKKSPESSIPEP